MVEKFQNQYAKDKNDNEIFIDDVPSGRRGYFCLGCDHQLEARKSRVQKSYFAHIPLDVGQKERECTYSDETYRHALAKRILMMHKKVKVPAIYKYPPTGKDKPIRIKESYYIDANHVHLEVDIFENENGKIVFQKYSRETFSLISSHIRADCVFFDKHDHPILIVEVAATHKVDKEKLFKLKNLGIDTVEISIPRGSPQEIEHHILSNSSKTIWLYNNEQESANYFQFSPRVGEGVQSDDKINRRISETLESFECKKSGVNNLIRRINKFMATAQYSQAESKIREEVGTQTTITENLREQWINIQEQITRGIQGEVNQYKTRNEGVREKLKRDYSEAIEANNREIERIDQELRELESRRTEARSRIREFGFNNKDIVGEERQIERETTVADNTIERRGNVIEKLRLEGEELERKIREGKTREFEEIRQRIFQSVEGGYFERVKAFAPLSHAILGTKGLASDYEKSESESRRYRRAKELFDQKVFKDWTLP